MQDRLQTNQLRIYFAIIVLAFSFAACKSSAQTPPAPSSEKPNAANESVPPAATTVQTKVEQTISAQTTAQPLADLNQIKHAPTEPAQITKTEIGAVIARIFEDAVSVDSEASSSIIVGDFNCDGSEDIAIVVKPADGRLSDINSEVANWTVLSPKKVSAPAMTPIVRQTSRGRMPERVEKDERLVAVIHGSGAKGWRDPAAKQTYLLRDVAGDQMKQISMKEFIKNVRDKDAIVKRSGDVISDTKDKETGFIFWNGSKYAWYH
jgi:PBP1b-binding outer membrane lipoprotein LpoB